jgi:uncharacterized membrane protein YphA (DoxX/SURF4 family)
VADQSQIPEPTELVYVPGPSWAPMFTAVGAAALAVGAFTNFIYAVAGAIILVIAAVHWFRESERAAERLPRRQQVTSAVIPPTELK